VDGVLYSREEVLYLEEFRRQVPAAATVDDGVLLVILRARGGVAGGEDGPSGTASGPPGARPRHYSEEHGTRRGYLGTLEDRLSLALIGLGWERGEAFSRVKTRANDAGHIPNGGRKAATLAQIEAAIAGVLAMADEYKVGVQ